LPIVESTAKWRLGDARREDDALTAHVAAGHAFVQNLRRGHYEITVDVPAHDRVRVAFTDLARCL
jgi:hypothetical protein